MWVRKIVGVVIVVVAVMLLGSLAVSNMPDARDPAPALFVSYNNRGDRATVMFSIVEESLDANLVGKHEVWADDEYLAGVGTGRYFTFTDYTVEDEGVLKFNGQTWVLSGEKGSRTLENVETSAGALWGTYYEDENEARKHPYQIPAL